MKNNIRLGLGILTVLATPFAVDAATGSNEAHAAQDTVKSAQVAKTTNKEEVKTTTQKQVESATKTEATKVETTKKENTKVEDTKKEATVNKEETTKKDASSEKQASSVKTVSGKPQAPTPNAAEKKTGWTKAGNTWFYYDAQGNQVKNTWVGSYWIGSDGKMVTNSWVDGGKYYVGSQGWWVKDAKKPADAQKSPEKKTGWSKNGNSWYYYDAQGNQIKNAWVGSYWIGSDGKMITDRWVDGGKYYVGSQGWWEKDAVKKTGWTQTGNTWYLYDNEGNIVKNRWSGNYWLGTDGKMVTNSWVDGGKYYVGADGKWVSDALKPGETRKGWTKAGSTWYFYNDKGNQVKNAWVGSYWLGADGKMETSSWVDNGRYYVGVNGVWDKNAKKPEAEKPVEKKQGWKKEDNAWYYYDNGEVARNKWIGDTYWVGKDGKMVTDNWVDNDRFYVDKSGRLAATTDIGPYLSLEANLKKGDVCSGYVFGFQSNGTALVCIEPNYYGLILKDEYYTSLREGDRLEGLRVVKTYEDGKLGLSTRAEKGEELDKLAKNIISYMEGNDGFMRFNDKSDPEELRLVFSTSKKNFKRSLGTLMKAGLVRQDEKGTWLL